MAYQHKLDKDIRCPLEYGLEIFGGKWKSRIICVLAAKETLRYSELRREMGNITDAVLAAALSFLWYRRMAFRAFGGITGDTAGWFLQICELFQVAGMAVAGKAGF